MKGKQIAGKGFADSKGKGKRKRDDGGDKSGFADRKRKNPTGVLKFFDNAAAEANNDSDSSDNDDFLNNFMDEEFATEAREKEPAKTYSIPFIPKEEEMDEEEFDKMMDARYKNGSGFVTYADDGYENKKWIDRDSPVHLDNEPIVWKVKCAVGRERFSAFCLMQKFVDLKSLGTKLQIISAFSVERIKGFIFIEADKQCDVNEACNGLCSIYPSRVMLVPKNEVSHLLSVRSKNNEVSKGTWVRVKNGIYKGDLAQVETVDKLRKRATVKLIPRIDLQAMAEKFGGVKAKKTTPPAPRLISSSELEEFRPLIQYRRDRDSGKLFEVLDGQLLKDGYLYKKISMDSLSCWGVQPSHEEQLKFNLSERNESNDLEWLSTLYNVRQKKKRILKSDKGSGKGEGTSSSSSMNNFELHDLVCIGRDFGVVIGMEKDDSYKILKEGVEGPAVLTVQPAELKHGATDMKFTALDQHKKTICVNDTVKVTEGPSEGKQGIVKLIYRGTVFLYDENETENGGYFCCKSKICEKMKLCTGACDEKGGESSVLGFEDFSSSPKSPLSPKKPWMERGGNRDFSRGDNGNLFSIGQTLRIRVGPLKGYLCRVLAVRRSDVTVKLDSKQQVLTVKCEHLSEVHGMGSAMSMSEDPGSSSLKPFDLLGGEGCSKDWTNGAGTSGAGDGWNAGGVSGERSSWSASGLSLEPDSNSANPFSSEGGDGKKGAEDTAWDSVVAPKNNLSWGASAGNNGQVAGWGKGMDSGDKARGRSGGFDSNVSGSWDKAVESNADLTGSSIDAGDSWGKNNNVADNQFCQKKCDEPWRREKNNMGNPGSTWSDATAEKNQLNCWGKGKGGGDASSLGNGWQSQNKDTDGLMAEDSWGKPTGKWGSKDGSSGGVSGWKGSSPGDGNQTNAGAGWTQLEAGDKDESSGWTNSKVVSGSQTGNWGNAKNSGEAATSWSNGKGKGSSDASAFGNGWQSQNKDTGGVIAEDSWGKASGKWSSKDGSSGGGSGWKGSTPGDGNQTNVDAGWTQPEARDKDESSGWTKSKVVSGSQTSNWGNAKSSGEAAASWSKGKSSEQEQTDRWKKASTESEHGGSSFGQEGGGSWGKQSGGSAWNKPAGGSSWSKQAGTIAEDELRGRDQDDGWNKTKGFAGDKGFGGVGNNDDVDMQNRWGRKNSYDEGCGSGRGGGRGGRDQFGWGRSSSQGQSSGWNKGQENNWTSDAMPSENRSDWGNKSKADDECKNDNGWRNPNASSNDNESGWNKGSGADNAVGGNKDKWNSLMSPVGNKSGCNTDWKERAPSSGGNSGGNWNSGSSDGGGHQDSRWGKKSNWNSGSNDTGGNQDSSRGKKSNWNSGFNETGGNQDYNWGKKSNEYDSESGGLDGNQESGWGKKNSWNAGSSIIDGNQDSRWGKKSNWNSGSNDTGGNQDSSRGKKSSWNSGFNETGGNQDYHWGKKSNEYNSESGGLDGNQESGWGEKNSWNAGSSIIDGNQDSGWVKKSSGNAGSSVTDGNQDSGWGKKSSWNAGSNVTDGNQDSGWGKKSSWNAGSNVTDGNQDSGWGKKSSWNADQDSAWGSKGGFGSGESSERGGFRGRRGSYGGRDGSRGGFGSSGGDGGGFGGRDGDRGGFGSRGGDRGGFGRRGGDRGDFGGRDGDREGFGGRGRSDRGGFGGRGGSDRGYGGRGRGRRDQSGGWNETNSGGDEPFSWSKGTGEWKSNNGAGSWKQEGGGESRWQGEDSGNETGNRTGWNNQRSGWNQGGSDRGGYGGWGRGRRDQSGGWNNTNAGGNEPSSWSKGLEGWKNNDGARSWKQQGGNKNQWQGEDSGNAVTSNRAGWNLPQECKDTGGWGKESNNEISQSKINHWKTPDASGGVQLSGWNKGPNSSTQSGGFTKQVSDWNKGGGNGGGDGNQGQSSGWGQSNVKDGTQSYGDWNQSSNAKESANEGGEATDTWGKAAASSWGKTDNSSDKGGW
ncbi:hypothetical protein FNV43_RR25161 [Rhamnella rubrinervis]|uniref:KOW domain-containing protein n=1 Tax=Rhamnella rubrinervis TaxID=2594499 RepID=A0A8K0DTS3_9ROSA|nr:hypothetical protein FNV43_RR25161 [Rhamnella rubrinervis]